MSKKIVNIQDMINTNLKGRVREESIRDLKLWLDSNEKIKLFERYVIGMGNNMLNLDVIAYRQLVLDNREMDLESVKKQLKCTETALETLRNLLLEEITEEEYKQFLELSANDADFIDKFVDYWNDRKGLSFSYLIKVMGVAA